MLDVFSQFDDTRLVCATLAVSARETSFEHSFGSGGYTGNHHPECDSPWQLLYRLDLSDPAIDIAIPNCRFLPLFCAFQYNSSTIQYRPLSDSKVEMISQERLDFTPKFPYEGFPTELPSGRVVILGETEDVEFDEDMQEFWWDFDEDRPLEPPPNRNELCALKAGVNQLQAVSGQLCKACSATMDFLATSTGEPEEDLVTVWGSDAMVAIVFMRCPQCNLIESSTLAN